MATPDDPIAPAIEIVQSTMGGLTKREWFAGLALQGLLANANDEVICRNIPADAVGWADALIAELAKEKP